MIMILKLGGKNPFFNITGNSGLLIQYYSHSFAFLEHRRGELIPRVQVIASDPGCIGECGTCKKTCTAEERSLGTPSGKNKYFVLSSDFLL